MLLRIVSAIVLATVSVLCAFTPASAAQPPQSLRLYVLDCGIITPPNVDNYGFKPGEVADDENRTSYLLGTPFKFAKHGESGLEFSDVLPNVARHADEIAVIRSMYTEHRNHEQAIWMANTGMIVAGRPNIGSL